MSSTDPARRRRRDAAPLAALGLILAIALGLRLWRIDHKNIWLDEAVSWDTAIRALPDLIRQTEGDIHPPLYYVMLKGWIAVSGDTLASLRGLSVVLGLIAIVLAARLAEGWLPRGPTIAALGWLAISPHMVAYAQEARMYASVTAAVLAACLAYRRWLESDGRSFRWLAVYIASATAAIYLHYFAALIFAALTVHLAIASRGTGIGAGAPPHRPSAAGTWLRWTAAHAVVVALYLPWLPTAFAQITRGQSWRQPVTLTELPRYAGGFVEDILLGPHHGAPLRLSIAAVVVCAVAGAGWLGLIVALARNRGRDRIVDAFFAIVCLVPLACALAAMPRTGQMQVSRYLAYLSPLVVLGAVRGLTSAGLGARTIIGGVAAATVGSAVWVGAYYADGTKDTDLRPIAAYLDRESAAARERGATGTVVVMPGYMSLPLAYDTREIPGLRYPGVSAGGLAHAIGQAVDSSADGPVWVAIERRWREFSGFDPASDSRLVEIDVTGNRRAHARLFQVRR